MSRKSHFVIGVSVFAFTAVCALTITVSRVNAEMASVMALPQASVLVPNSRTLVAPPPPPTQMSAPAVMPMPKKPPMSGYIEHRVNISENWRELFEQGQALYNQGKYDDAYKIWKLSLAEATKDKVWLRTSSADEQIEILKKLAMMHKTASEPAQAAEKYNLALSTAIKTYGRDSSIVADLMLDQGRMYTFYDQLKNPSKASELMDEAFRIKEKLYGRMSIPTGDVGIAIAQLKEQESKFDKALEYWQLAIDIGDKLEPNDISCCRIGPRQGKARCLEALGRFEDAVTAHKDLISMCQAGAPNMMPTVTSAYASCLMKSGHETEAGKIYQGMTPASSK